MEPIIKVEKLGKKYLINHEDKEPYVAMRDVITNKFKSVFSSKKNTQLHKEEFWALELA